MSSCHQPGHLPRVSVHYSLRTILLEKRCLFLGDSAEISELARHHHTISNMGMGLTEVYASFI